MSAQPALSVYAVVPAAARVRKSWHAPGGQPLRLLRFEGVALLVSDVIGAPKPDRRLLIEHDALMRQIAAAVPALLPARFGLIVRSDQWRPVVALNLPRLHEALRLVAGREQMTMRVGLPASSSVAAVPVPARSGTEYLAARAVELQIPSWTELRDLLQRVSPLVRAEQVELAQERGLLVAYHLVDRGRAADYLAIASAFASMHPDQAVVATGPFPPYAFSPRLEIGSPSP